MKVLITTGIYPPEVGGPATYTKLMEGRLPALGWAVEVLPFRTVRSLPKIIRHLAFAWKALRAGRDADVIYTQDVGSVGFPSLIAAKLLRKPFAVRVPGDYAWEQSTQRFGVTDTIDAFQTKRYGTAVELLRTIQRMIVRHADLVIAPSRYFAELVSAWDHTGRVKAKAIYNGIDFPDVLPSRDEARKASGYADDDRIVMSAGRFVPWKGFLGLIDAVAALHAEDPSWRLVIFGEGPERTALERAIDEHDARAYITLPSEQSRTDMLRSCRAADVFVLNSSFESFSFQTIEMMAAEVPFVGTTAGSVPELVRDGTDGLLVTYGDRTALMNAIRRTVEDAPGARERTKAAAERSHEFTIDRTVRETAAALAAVLPKPHYHG